MKSFPASAASLVRGPWPEFMACLMLKWGYSVNRPARLALCVRCFDRSGLFSFAMTSMFKRFSFCIRDSSLLIVCLSLSARINCKISGSAK